MQDPASLDYGTFVQAARNWDNAHNIVPSRTHWVVNNELWPSFSNGLGKFLDWELLYQARWADFKKQQVLVPKHTLRKFQLLAGPYAATWIRVYEIRKSHLT